MATVTSDSTFTSVADAAACGVSLRAGSHTFFAASLVLPSTLRRPATALYAFCRMADDAIDQGEDSSAALGDLRSRLERIYQGEPDNQASDRAFADAVSQFRIPKSVPIALLEGFAWDAECRQYESFSQLTDYAMRVAGTVGMMMAMIMGIRDATRLARAADLGVAMQLTNIARDVGEDARNGRIYLPLQWLREAGIEPKTWLAQPVFSEALAHVIRRLLEAAETLYDRSESGLARLPRSCRVAMYAARLLYAEIGREVARRDFDSITQRAVVGWPRKAGLLAEAGFAAMLSRRPIDTDEILPEANFLLENIATRETLPTRDSGPSVTVSWPQIEHRVVWLVNLFERLERQDRKMLRGVYS
jgi:15-cis-phytoene synthase